MHEWMTDNGLTPHIVIDMTATQLDVPLDDVRENRLVLNVSYAATRGLAIGNEAVAFEARFNGVPKSLHVPIGAVLGIYARENGQGMVFSEEVAPPPEDPSPDSGPSEGKRPTLKVVK